MKKNFKAKMRSDKLEYGTVAGMYCSTQCKGTALYAVK